MTPKTGPLTISEMRDVWRGALDRAYREPIEAAGDGNGLEAHGQMWAQYSRVSLAVDVTTQAMFISPWSGQTNPESSGERRATVTLTFERTKFLDKPMVLAAGAIFFAEETTDWGDPEGVVVRSGRRYVLTEDLVFHPGDAGPLSAEAIAELPGYGYNNPLPGTIRAVDQPGREFLNDLARVTVTGPVGAPADLRTIAQNEPDMFVPEQVGQYILFTAGANIGNLGRITAFIPPAPPLTGSTALLGYDQSIEATSFSGEFIPGEPATVSVVAGSITILGARAEAGLLRLTYTMGQASANVLPVGAVITGSNSGATATISHTTFPQTWVAEAPSGGVGGASWRTVDWVSDFGMTITNEQSPQGGRHGWLDELGNERGLYRSPGEDDESYRDRVSRVADTVAPNAIKRTLSRILGNIPWCLREVGTSKLPGFFYDGTGEPPDATPHGAANDAYDTDVVILEGTVASGSFIFQERVQLQDGDGNLVLLGYFGRLDAGNTILTFIRTEGVVPSDLTLGYNVVGMESGAVFEVDDGSVPDSVKEREFRVYLDYSQFRGFFIICLPKLGYGEFGFAYDVGSSNAYDAFIPTGNFYDGSPYLESQVYSRVYQAIDPIRAGGVLFDLKRGCEDCDNTT